MNRLLPAFLLTISFISPGWCGVDCDGTDDFVNLGATSQMPTNAFTFAMWVNPDTTCSSEQDIVREEDQTLDAGGFISGCGWTSTKFRGYAYTGSYVSTGDSSTTISAGTWYHVAITYDKDAGTNNLKLYVNGSNESSATTTNPISWTASRNVTLCNYRVFSSYPGTLSAQYPFNGKISSMGVWSKALSAVEINQLYLSKVKRMCLQISSLNQCLEMDDQPEGTSCTGDTFNDLSANSYNALGDDGANDSGMGCLAETILSYQ